MEIIYKNKAYYPFFAGQEVLTRSGEYGIINREIFNFGSFFVQIDKKVKVYTLFQLEVYK